VLTVVIPATDAPASLDRCLAALARCAERHEVEVVAGPPGLGPAGARNAGVARGGAPIVVFVDADVEVHVDALRRLRERLDADPALDAVFGAYDDCPAAPQVVSRFRNLLHHHVHAGAAGPATTFWAGLGAIRREAFDAVGGFDERRFPRSSIEDIELGMRLHSAGRRIVLDPSVRGTHLKRWTLRSMVHTDLARRGAPWVALAVGRREAPASLNLGWHQRAATAGALVAVTAPAWRRPRLAVAGLVLMLLPNTGFYVLLARAGGIRLALLGVPLHLAHHLTAALSVPVGLVMAAAAAGRDAFSAGPPP
jgi:GT2 family glycosyltransferase